MISRRAAGALALRRHALVLWTLMWLVPAGVQAASDDMASVDGPTAIAPPLPWNLHGQFTSVLQYHPAFSSPYQGTNSLDPGNNGKETTDVTAFAGVGLWSGAAAYVDPEIDQGFGLSDTLGIAGFPSGEAYKVGARNPYFRLSRAFVRQVIGLDATASASAIEDGANELAGSLPADNLTITFGKFSVVDIFDTNSYAHDPRADFLNWSIVESGAFDYAADAWGYTYGTAAEWTQSWWSARGGFFALSKVPNSKDIDGQFRQFSIVAEFEERHHFDDQPGKFKVLAFLLRGRMGGYEDAVALARQSSTAASTALVRQYASRPGLALNLEQAVSSDLGLFARASINDGTRETFDFTDINHSLAAGLSLRGARWGRPDDTVGLAAAANGLSSAARDYFAAGGLGVLIGDGRLPDYGWEKLLETYYSVTLNVHLTMSADMQYVVDPAYNRDRGPVAIFGLRVHAQF